MTGRVRKDNRCGNAFRNSRNEPGECDPLSDRFCCGPFNECGNTTGMLERTEILQLSIYDTVYRIVPFPEYLQNTVGPPCVDHCVCWDFKCTDYRKRGLWRGTTSQGNSRRLNPLPHPYRRGNRVVIQQSTIWLEERHGIPLSYCLN